VPIDRNVAEILECYHVGRYPKVRRAVREERLQSFTVQ